MYKKIIAALLSAGTAMYAENLSSLLASIESNDGLQAQKALEQAAEGRYSSVIRGYAPKFELLGGYSKKSQTTDFEPKETKLGEAKAGVAIFDGLKREGSIMAASKSAESEKYKTGYMRQSIMLDTVREYFGAITATAMSESLGFKISELNQNIKRLSILTQNGLATKDTLEAMIASKKEAEYELENVTLSLQNSLLKLELYTGKSGILPIKTVLFEPDDKKAERADIKADKLVVEGLKWQEWQNTYLPSLMLESSHKKYSYGPYNDMGGAQKLPEWQNTISLQLSFTIFDFGKIAKEREAARLQTLAASKNLAYKQNGLAIESKLKKIELEAAKKKLDAAKAALAATETSYGYTKKRFDANLVSYTDYLSELTKKEAALSRVASASSEVEIKKAELAFANGTDIKTLTKGE